MVVSMVGEREIESNANSRSVSYVCTYIGNTSLVKGAMDRTRRNELSGGTRERNSNRYESKLGVGAVSNG
jgi:hypothetical protein